MANPVIITLTPAAWSLVATSVNGGIIHKLTSQEMLQTYRTTGGVAPTDISEGVVFDPGLTISSSTAIDVYIFCKEAGKIRLDL